MSVVSRRDLETITNSLAAYLPGGRLFTAKSVDGTVLRRLLFGLATELLRSNDLIEEYCSEILPDETVKFIAEWESALGIPDDCFLATGTIDERRRDILVKFAASGVQSKADFEELALRFGIEVVVESGSKSGTFPLEFPAILFDSSKQARFTIVVNFEILDSSRFTLVFPFVFGGNEIAILQCLFSKLKPANCALIFGQIVPPVPVNSGIYNFQDDGSYFFEDGVTYDFN